MNKPILILAVLAAMMFSVKTAAAEEPNAGRLVQAAFEHYRGQASKAEVQMTIHRPDWARTLTMSAWTRGESDSLIRIESPPKDKGNGTLKIGSDMWLYNPKINRVIKLPPSMMSQSWMGSDFSNNDLAKSDSILHDYRHTIDSTAERDGMRLFWIKAMPKPDAPVIWGMQKLAIREDDIIVAQQFYDEDMVLVKSMQCGDIKMMGDRLFPVKWRMQKAETQGHYTELVYKQLRFMDGLPDRIFTLSNLKNPRR